MSNFPSYLEAASTGNKLELSALLQSKLPWLKLNIDVPEFQDSVFDEVIQQCTDWRSQWSFTDAQHDHGVSVDGQKRDWEGQVLFGPGDWDAFQSKITGDLSYDADGLCKHYRNDFDFEWRLSPKHEIRKFVESIFPNQEDIYLVNFYVLPPGGYLFPHKDPTQDTKQLNKLYIPLRWPAGCEFGFYRWGNMPAKQGKVYLVDNYSHTHWVLNRSNEHRVVLDICGNLQSIEHKIKESFYENFS